MASICVPLHELTCNGIVTALVKNDLLLKTMSFVYGEGDAIDPGDDYHTAPYAILKHTERRSKHVPNPPTRAWVVFTSYKLRDPHTESIKRMGVDGAGIEELSSFRCIEDGYLTRSKIAAKNIVKLRRYASAGGEDVCQLLELDTVEKGCRLLGVPVSDGWKEARAALLLEMQSGKDAERGKLAELPEYGKMDHRPLSPQQLLEAQEQRRQEEETAKKARVEQIKVQKHEGDLRRAHSYLPTLDKFSDPEFCPGAADTNQEECCFVFDATRQREKGKCNYDKSSGSHFCSICNYMIDFIPKNREEIDTFLKKE